MPKMIWLGMDVHAASITVARYDDDAPTATVRTIPNDRRRIRRLLSGLPTDATIRACYEAGPCGYGFQRELAAQGVACAVIAPALTPRKPGERIKTDRRDAEKLGRYHRSGDLTVITVPTVAQEALRDLVRAREDVRRDRTAARQRLGKFLLRQGFHYGGTHWSHRHWLWIRSHTFTGPTSLVFEHYCGHVVSLNERLADLERALAAVAQSPAYQPLVARLVCLRGIAPLAAVIVLAELYDLRRFRTPRELMAYLGLVPSEHSSGAQQRRGRITKTGNAYVRRVLIEAAWAYRHPARQTRRVVDALATQPAEVRAISERALHRLTARYQRLLARGKPPHHAVTVVARELCGFLWAAAVAAPAPASRS
jgi:transposase